MRRDRSRASLACVLLALATAAAAATAPPAAAAKAAAPTPPRAAQPGDGGNDGKFGGGGGGPPKAPLKKAVSQERTQTEVYLHYLTDPLAVCNDGSPGTPHTRSSPGPYGACE
jgi:hypothetical protein